MRVREVTELLDAAGVDYEVLHHEAAESAQALAAATHTPGGDVAKVVMVRVDDRLVMAVVPASHRIDVDRLREGIGGEHAAVAYDAATGWACLPPFGRLIGVETVLATALAESLTITFTAGSPTQAIRMRLRDYERVARPILADFAPPSDGKRERDVRVEHGGADDMRDGRPNRGGR